MSAALPLSEDESSAPRPPHHMTYKYSQPSHPPLAIIQNSTMMQQNMQSSVQCPIQGQTPRLKQGPVIGPMQGHIPVRMKGLLHGSMPMPFFTRTMPPPPPTSKSSTRMAAPVHSSPQPAHQSSFYQPATPRPKLIAMFDPTRPPPQITRKISPGPLKREADQLRAGPSKVRKVDPTNDTSCKCCVRLLIRTDQLSKKMSRLELEVEQARSDLSYKMDMYEKKKEVLRSILGTGIYPRVLEYIENGSPAPLSMRNEACFHSFSSPVAASLNMNYNIIQQMLRRLVDINTRGQTDPISPATESDVGFLPAAAQPRPSNGSADINMLLDLITNVPSVASASGPSEAELSLAGSSGNGFSRFLGAGGTSPPARTRSLPPISLSEGVAGSVQYAPAPPPRYPPPPRHFPPPPPAPALAPHPAPPAYPPAHTVPPPRPHYSHGHFAPNTMHMGNPPYPGSAGAGSALTQPLRPPMPPQQPQNSPYYMGGRYPDHHYYPPYQ